MVVHSSSISYPSVPLISYICSLQADLNHFSSIACLWWSFTFHGNPMKTLDAIATKKSHTHIVVKMLSKQRATATLFYDQIYIKLATNEAGHKSCTSFQPDQTTCMSYLLFQQNFKFSDFSLQGFFSHHFPCFPECVATLGYLTTRLLGRLSPLSG